MDLTFNIIFVPGGVRYLRLAILSLLKYSTYRFRLVGNGLKRDELKLLKDFCGSSDRLEFYAYPTGAALPHGTLLTLLARRESGDYFCFMDPDIFASGPYQVELEAQLQDCDVFSSCYHLGLDPNERLSCFRGRSLQTPTGLPLATTFFCVYRQAPLRRLMCETGVGFERCIYPEHCPDHVAEILQGMEMPNVRRCDTAKLLNVLCHAYRLRLKYHPLGDLTHIGGLADCFMHSGWSSPLAEKVGQWMGSRHTLSDADLEPKWGVFRKVRGVLKTRSFFVDDSAEVAKRRAQLRRRRPAIFFARFLQSLFDGTPEPQLALADQALAGRMAKLCSVIRELYGEHYDRLRMAA